VQKIQNFLDGIKMFISNLEVKKLNAAQNTQQSELFYFRIFYKTLKLLQYMCNMFRTYNLNKVKEYIN